jgi:aspartate/methionine/tyrosine aminotransferase
MAFCQNHRIHLISDEVYGLSVFDTGNPDAMSFTSVLSFDTTGLIDDELLHVLYGMSKVSPVSKSDTLSN